MTNVMIPLIYHMGAVVCLAVVVMMVACSGGSEPTVPAETAAGGSTTQPATTLEPGPTATPVPAAELMATLVPTPAPTRPPSSTTTPTAPRELAAAEIYAKVAPSVAFIQTPTSFGSGFLIEGGYLVTNLHVVWPPSGEESLVFPDGTQLNVPVVAWDPMSDIALLGPVEAGVPPLVLGDGESLPVGSEVFLLGYPGESDSSPTPTILSGLLSHNRQWNLANLTYLQADTAVAGGQSGGVLVNAKGEVIGIVGFSFTEANYALAASAADIEPILQQLIQGKDPSGVSNRRFRDEQPGNEFTDNLPHPWDSRMFLMEVDTGDLVEIEIDCPNPLRIKATDHAGNVILDVDNGFGGAGQGSAQIQMNGHHFLAVETLARSPSCFDLMGNVPMIPFNDPDDGQRLNLHKTIAGNIDYPGDRDWFALHLGEGELVKISADSFNVDTVIHVDFPNSHVNQVIQDDDGGGGLFETNSELVYRAPKTGDYIIAVQDFYGDALGGYFLSVDRALPGSEAVTVPPAPQEVDSPFGRMIVYRSQLSDFSVQVPAEWVQMHPDADLGFTFKAVNAEEDETAFIGIMEFDLQESNERQTPEELANSIWAEMAADGIKGHRDSAASYFETAFGDRGVVLEFRLEIEPDEFGAVRILVSIQDERFAFVVFYLFTRDESKRALTEYSFDTLKSSKDGRYFLGRWLHVRVVSMERLPELRYSTIDPGDVVRRWSLSPSNPGNELVLVRLKVENHTVDRVSIDIDGPAAELRDLANTTFRPVSIAETVWQDFHGAPEALVRMDRGQCFDGGRALIEPGTTVRWQSEDDTAQILAFENPSVAVGPGGRVELAPNEAVSHAFHEPGTYQYVCRNLYGGEWPAEVRVVPAADRSEEAMRSVLFLEDPFELLKGYGLDGYLVFEVPAGSRFQGLRWLAGDSITIPGKALPTPTDSAATGGSIPVEGRIVR